MSFNIAKVEALVWDIGGTVFDWHNTIKKEIFGKNKHKTLDLPKYYCIITKTLTLGEETHGRECN